MNKLIYNLSAVMVLIIQLVLFIIGFPFVLICAFVVTLREEELIDNIKSPYRDTINAIKYYSKDIFL